MQKRKKKTAKTSVEKQTVELKKLQSHLNRQLKEEIRIQQINSAPGTAGSWNMELRFQAGYILGLRVGLAHLKEYIGLGEENAEGRGKAGK